MGSSSASATEFPTGCRPGIPPDREATPEDDGDAVRAGEHGWPPRPGSCRFGGAAQPESFLAQADATSESGSVEPGMTAQRCASA
jgi:hypothetical protein